MMPTRTGSLTAWSFVFPIRRPASGRSRMILSSLPTVPVVLCRRPPRGRGRFRVELLHDEECRAVPRPVFLVQPDLALLPVQHLPRLRVVPVARTELPNLPLERPIVVAPPEVVGQRARHHGTVAMARHRGQVQERCESRDSDPARYRRPLVAARAEATPSRARRGIPRVRGACARPRARSRSRRPTRRPLPTRRRTPRPGRASHAWSRARGTRDRSTASPRSAGPVRPAQSDRGRGRRRGSRRAWRARASGPRAHSQIEHPRASQTGQRRERPPGVSSLAGVLSSRSWWISRNRSSAVIGVRPGAIGEERSAPGPGRPRRSGTSHPRAPRSHRNTGRTVRHHLVQARRPR